MSSTNLDAARLSVEISAVRSRMLGAMKDEPVFDTLQWASDALEQEGYPRDNPDALWVATGKTDSRIGEIAYVVFAAFNELEADGLICHTPTSAIGVSAIDRYAESHATRTPATWQQYVATPRGLIAIEAPPSADVTGWIGVDRLVGQAVVAHRFGLDVAAAATARVAVEEAVEVSLMTLLGADAEWVSKRSWEREAILFTECLPPRTRGFKPIDRQATQAALSAIRDRGNDAAHSGEVADPLVLQGLILLLPPAVASLASATQTDRP